MLITAISIKARCDKRKLKREKETAKITAQLTWKVICCLLLSQLLSDSSNLSLNSENKGKIA